MTPNNPLDLANWLKSLVLKGHAADAYSRKTASQLASRILARIPGKTRLH